MTGVWCGDNLTITRVDSTRIGKQVWENNYLVSENTATGLKNKDLSKTWRKWESKPEAIPSRGTCKWEGPNAWAHSARRLIRLEGGDQGHEVKEMLETQKWGPLGHHGGFGICFKWMRESLHGLKPRWLTPFCLSSHSPCGCWDGLNEGGWGWDDHINPDKIWGRLA